MVYTHGLAIFLDSKEGTYDTVKFTPYADDHVEYKDKTYFVKPAEYCNFEGWKTLYKRKRKEKRVKKLAVILFAAGKDSPITVGRCLDREIASVVSPSELKIILNSNLASDAQIASERKKNDALLFIVIALGLGLIVAALLMLGVL